MATLELIHVTKRFGKDVVAVDDFSLQVEDGEFLVLLGPSGCGKTTTLRMIAGLEEVTQGRILIDGEDVTDLPPRKRNVSMVFQNYAVWPHMTVYENIAYPLRLKRVDKRTIDETVREAAAARGGPDGAPRACCPARATGWPIAGLSGGRRQATGRWRRKRFMVEYGAGRSANG